MPLDHFKGKSVPEHLKEARIKGAIASAEIHGIEISNFIATGFEAARHTLIFLFLLWMLFPHQILHCLLFSTAFLVWKSCHVAFLSWSCLERVHRITEEERWEIEHNREQEKEELKMIYMAKGLSGKLLEDVVSVFMANDHRALNLMLEEELGLTLESYDHPLQQGISAALGVLIATIFFLSCSFFLPFGFLVGLICGIGLTAAIQAKILKNRVIDAVVWSLAIAILMGGTAHFLKLTFTL